MVAGAGFSAFSLLPLDPSRPWAYILRASWRNTMPLLAAAPRFGLSITTMHEYLGSL